MRRALAIAAGVALAALAIYAAAGYWIAPRFVRDALVEQAAQRGVELRIGEVRTKPFALAVELEGIEAKGPGGRKLAAVRSARADLAWSSLFGPSWRVQSLSLEQPQVFVAIGAEPLPSPPAGRQTKPFVVERLRASEGVFELTGDARDVRLVGLEIEASGLSSVPGEAGEYQAAGRAASGGTLSSQGRITLHPLGVAGHLGAAALELPAVMRLAWPALEPAPGQLDGSGEFTWADGRFAFEQLALEAVERGGGARATAQGTMAFAPFAADLQVHAAGIGPAYVRRWLPESLRPKLVSGALSLDGRLTDARYEGAAAIAGFRLDEADSGLLLLAWKRLASDAAKLEFAPFALDLGEVVASAPEGRLVIEADGSVNFSEAFGGKPGNGGDGGEPLRVSVARTSIEHGVLHFADLSLETPFRASIRELEGTITGFGTARDDPARVALSGRVEKYGSAQIRGSINLGAPLEHADIRAQFRNIAIAPLTPYVVRFAGYRVRSGRLSAVLHYEVQNGQLVGRNELVFRELRLGEKVERQGLKSLPLDLMVALLADSEGRINLDIPVTGSLTDPDFDLGGLLGRALAGVVGKIVSAPFRALAGLFGGENAESGEALAAVRFPAGSAELPPPEAQQVARVAQALGERPGLAVAVHGGYDPRADAAALRSQAVRREILRRAGYETGGLLDLDEPKILQAARELYRKRIGEPGTLDAKALVERLAEERTLEAGALQELARKRAQAVGAALADRGVDSARVATAVREGTPTELELAALSSAVLAQDALVQAAQRTLNATGFDAGPVDGILGPATEEALREFQRATHLDASGMLDAATLNALGLQPAAAAGASR